MYLEIEKGCEISGWSEQSFQASWIVETSTSNADETRFIFNKIYYQGLSLCENEKITWADVKIWEEIVNMPIYLSRCPEQNSVPKFIVLSNKINGYAINDLANHTTLYLIDQTKGSTDICLIKERLFEVGLIKANSKHWTVSSIYITLPANLDCKT